MDIIINKKLLVFAGILFITSTALTFPFPDTYLSSRTLTSIFNIPITTMDGVNTIGVFGLLLLVASLLLLAKSLDKYRVRSVFVAMILFMLMPYLLISIYQQTIATGIYAVNYELDSSQCEFTRVDANTVNGVCEFSFTNNSRNAVEFGVEFYDDYWYEESVQTVSLMNTGAPYKVELAGKEKKRVTVETNIDVSEVENQFDQASSYQVNIKIHAENEERKL
ncbi:hypothetical protein SAMN05192533_11521 [Mesobacillus persicus]|uniref:Uncharacterized protein n=1 Tax=Mesobacillus persicus TaxID=930146 RepID=A0A1H8HHX1_9BACI|nr:hypothetical protein [Mesobacillus persicus]SEN55557.1 hypothetical protein SAMN05192533_11521 [Mesobacillus persicus]